MRIGILADIHGNHGALQAVLWAARGASTDRLLVAGDIVGYYYDAQKAIDCLEEFDWTAISGNHEAMLRRLDDEPSRAMIRKKYGSGLEIGRHTLRESWLQHLVGLPACIRLSIAGFDVLMCHGSPWRIDEYIYPDANDETRGRLFAFDRGADLLILGHTHYPVVWREQNRYVVNPGSVGQTRDRIPGACWALWDTDDHTVELRRETYDPTDLVQQCKRNDPENSYLSQVLVRT